MGQASKSVEQTVKPWRVLHACETVATAAPLAEAQSAVGMNPQLLSREYWSPGKANDVSLLNVWHDVRGWRHALNEAEALTSVQIVHAHSFASAMAGVRGSLPLVYDFVATLQDVATHQSHRHSGTWLLRSLRVAEQFALTRAGAVVAHSAAMKKVAHERGAAEENIFVVPDLCSVADIEVDREWARDHALDIGHDVIVFALADPRGIESLLRSFVLLSSTVEHAVLVFELDSEHRGPMVRLARELGIADTIRRVGADERSQAVACANVVIAPPYNDTVNRGMLQAMAAGRAVIAADVPENRECSPDGRGCVWFKAEDDLDMVQRTVFVMHNPEFARSLGENGRTHIAANRTVNVVGEQYDEVYRRAVARRTDTSFPKPEMPKIYALGMQMR
jgi:glycosyltransferase involved in cell wall biosynthesis